MKYVKPEALTYFSLILNQQGNDVRDMFTNIMIRGVYKNIDRANGYLYSLNYVESIIDITFHKFIH